MEYGVNSLNTREVLVNGGQTLNENNRFIFLDIKPRQMILSH